MLTFAAAWISAALASLILVDIVRRLSERFAHYDRPNERSSHTMPTPTTGGVAIVVTVVAVLLGVKLMGTLPQSAGLRALPALLAAAILIAAISFVDDLRPLSAPVRFAVHLIAAIVVVNAAGHWAAIALPNGRELALGALGLPLTCLWIVGMTNIYNFMDGIDGLAGSHAVVAGVTWAFIGVGMGIGHRDPLVAAIGGTVAAAAAGFLVHNWSPARIFMGDVGSAFLGFMLASLPLLSHDRDALFVPALLALWPFVFDGTLTILRRLRRGENIFAAHRSHLYQRLNVAGRSHAFITTLYIALALVSAAAAVTLHVVAIGAAVLGAVALWVFVVRVERLQGGSSPSSRSSRRMPSRNDIGA